MKTQNHLVALAALLLVSGCGSQESAAPMSAAAEEQASAPAPTSQPRPENEPAAQKVSPGLAVGEKAPAFELTDQHGQTQSLGGILESGSAAIVFYRSADW